MGKEDESEGDLGTFSTTEFDDTLKEGVVVVAKGEGADGHDLRDRAKVKVVGVTQTRQVQQAARGQLERIRDEVVQASKCL